MLIGFMLILLGGPLFSTEPTQSSYVHNHYVDDQQHLGCAACQYESNFIHFHPIDGRLWIGCKRCALDKQEREQNQAQQEVRQEQQETKQVSVSIVRTSASGENGYGYSPEESARLRSKAQQETETFNRWSPSLSSILLTCLAGTTAATVMAAQDEHKKEIIEAVSQEAVAFMMNDGSNPSLVLQAVLSEVRKNSLLFSEFEIQNASEMTDVELSSAILKSLSNE